MEDRDVVKAVIDATRQVQSEERPLQPGASERSFAHRLAVHMEPLFEGWDTDCEYNRRGQLPKQLIGVSACDNQRTTDRIYPDIIVHQRTNSEMPTDGENLLVIEMKHNDEQDLCDKTKLELLTNPRGYYRYQLGLYININPTRGFVYTWYKNGADVSQESLLAS